MSAELLPIDRACRIVGTATRSLERRRPHQSPALGCVPAQLRVRCLPMRNTAARRLTQISSSTRSKHALTESACAWRDTAPADQAGMTTFPSVRQTRTESEKPGDRPFVLGGPIAGLFHVWRRLYDLGCSTPSITCTTPFDVATSAVTTVTLSPLASVIVTLPSSTFGVSSSP